jgi:hypothetical protein
MTNRLMIAAATLALFSATAMAQAAGAQSEPKQKGAEKSEPVMSGANANDNNRKPAEYPARTEERIPDESKAPARAFLQNGPLTRLRTESPFHEETLFTPRL